MSAQQSPLRVRTYLREIDIEINYPSLIPVAKRDIIPKEMRERFLMSKHITLRICRQIDVHRQL